MKEWFPAMLDAPEGHTVGSSVLYWLMAFLVLPLMLSLGTINSRGQEYEIWMDIGYHVINFVCVLGLFFRYLRESFYTLRSNLKMVLGVSAIGAVLIIVIKLFCGVVAAISGNISAMHAAFGTLLTTENDVLFYATAVLEIQPLWGTLCLGILAPITVSCMLYATVFAPICTSRPWLAYLITAVMLLLQRLAMTISLFPLQEELAIFAVQLPVHMLACWTYQKTDTVWTPILLHVAVNMVIALFICLM